MSEQTFKSPGFFDSEIDLSATSQSSTGTPAGVIGTAQKGPAFLPVTVSSFKEFTDIFGEPDGKKFGPYAVKEFLKNRDALTYVRVLGAGGGTSSGEATNAGFKIDSTLLDSTATTGDDSTDSSLRYTGSTQFIVATQDSAPLESVGNPLFTDSDISDTHDMVRAMLLLPVGTRMMVHADSALSTPWVGSNLNDSISPTDQDFKLILSGTSDTTDGFSGITVYSASLNPESDKYISKVLNTDPSRFVADSHVLYADFPIESDMLDGTTPMDAITIASGSTGTSFGDFSSRYSASKTTTFISQPFGSKEYDLFHFETLHDGASMNENFKVSISDLKFSTIANDQWPTFTVQIRNFYDTDTSKQVIEQFSNCNLNPMSDRYVAKIIGDKKIYYNFDASSVSERRMVKSGKFDNKSNYVRIVMDSDVINGNIPLNTLPFGFKALKTLDTFSSNLSYWNGTAMTAISSAYMPPLPLRFKVTKNSLKSASPTYTGDAGTNELVDSRFYWGVKFTKLSTTLDSPLLQPNKGDFNPLINSYAKMLAVSDDLTAGAADGSDATAYNKFTLSRVALNEGTLTDVGSADDEMLMAAYIRNGDYFNVANTITDDVGTVGARLTFASLANATDKSTFNRFSKYMKFTNMFSGGFDGVNILNADTASLNDRASSIDTGGLAVGDATTLTTLGLKANPLGSGEDNNTVNSFRSAINILTDEMSSRINILAIPGMRDAFITDYAAEKVRDFGMAIYLMDMVSYASSGGLVTRIFDNDGNEPDTDETVARFSARRIDNNYIATYYPDVKVYDDYNKIIVDAPSSIAALAAIGYNDSVSYPWFAPAGFNRASLDSVQGVSARLNTTDRDNLYEERINPIAKFPNAGYVIFGQKTLQALPSSLDRVNVRRTLLEVKRQVSAVAKNMLFELNNVATRAKFVAQITPKLSAIQTQQGIDKFSIVIDDSNNTPADIEANKMNGRIVLIPTRAIEYVAIDFIVTGSGVSFE